MADRLSVSLLHPSKASAGPSGKQVACIVFSKLWKRLVRGKRPERGRECGFRLAKYFNDSLAVRLGELCEAQLLIFARKDFREASVDRVLDTCGKSLERRRVNQVAARITEHALLKIELAQRSAFLVLRAFRGKFLGEARRAFNLARNFRLTDK